MEIRTPVLTLKGSRPGPLDDGGKNRGAGISSRRQALCMLSEDVALGVAVR